MLDTALPNIDLVHDLDRLLKKLVFTANQATLWEALRLADWIDAGFSRSLL